MKIVFLGNFRVDYTSESHYLKTFRKLGHTVIPLQEGEATADMIMRSALDADMFFWVHTHGWYTHGIESVLKKLKEKGVPSVGYHLDLWRGLGREVDIKSDPYWNIEYFFTVDKLFVPDLERLGIKAFYLPPGVFEDECYLAHYNPSLAFDVVFTGSGVYHSEWSYRAKLIQWLKDTYGERFAHFGSGGRPVVRGEQLNELYASSKIIIGDTLCKGFDYPYYFSDRLFEVPGRGGFMIFPYIKGLEDNFEIGNEIVTYDFNDFDGLKRKIDFYLEANSRREGIRLAGHERTKRDHTYTDRLQTILAVVKGWNVQGQ